MSFLPKLIGIGSIKLIRSFHRSCTFGSINDSYTEDEGKTTVTILNHDIDYGLMVDEISTGGFKLNNGVWILGPTIIFPKSAIGWNIESTDHINENSLALFRVLQPTLDILVIGLDKKYDYTTPFLKTLKSFAKKLEMNIEILQVEHACTTFNFLNSERRYVAAALLPPEVQLPKELKAIEDMRMRRSLSRSEKKLIAD